MPTCINISYGDTIKMLEKDESIFSLLELNGTRYVVDEHLGLWVKFEAKLVEPDNDRPHGIKYSLNLHDRFNSRILGFDNAHAIEYGKKNGVAPVRTHYHLHLNEKDKGRPYSYENAGKLLEDFWVQVDKVIKNFKENLK